LAPLQSFQSELQIDFREQLENPHVISPDQVLISILKKGVDGQCFDFSYKNRESLPMILDLGKTVAQVAKMTPGGMLVFFPSYGLLEQCFELWEHNKILPEILSYK
jgi:regulator of telomere elongation helicase 1